MKIKVSVAQCGTAGYDVDKTLDRMEGYVQEAKAVGSQLVLFPEAFVGGYPKFESFGAVVGTRSAAGRQTFAAYHKAAITIPGPANTRIEDIARRSGVFIITGLIEKDGGTLYCVVGFYSPTEGLVYKRRKLMPTASEKLIWGFGDGSTISAVTHTFPSAAAEVDVGAVDGPAAQAPTLASNSESSPVVIGSAICWENMMPLLRQHFWNQGVQIHCTPTVDGRENWQSTIKHLAMEGRCFVLNACQFAQQKDYPEGHPIEGPVDPEGIMIAGGSVIVSPLGEVLAGPLRGKAGLISAVLDLDEILGAKLDLDNAGHYTRPDIFKLEVNGK